ncbi:MAG: CHRD domain-containing protein [Solirubrobacteraceae bacterium]
MRSKLLIPGLAVAALGIAACGSSSSSSPRSGSSPGGKTTKVVAVPSRTYSVKMTGKVETPPGAPKGSGAAVVALHGKADKVCWRFSHLTGFTAPTLAHIHLGPAGKAGAIVVPLSSAAKFKSKGCVPASPTLITAIEKDPHGYYVNVHNKHYPGGAVRAQL